MPAHHENKIGVGANSINARPDIYENIASADTASAAGTSSSSKAPARYQSESFKQSKY